MGHGLVRVSALGQDAAGKQGEVPTLLFPCQRLDLSGRSLHGSPKSQRWRLLRCHQGDISASLLILQKRKSGQYLQLLLTCPLPTLPVGISWDRRLTWLLGWGRLEYLVFSLWEQGPRSAGIPLTVCEVSLPIQCWLWTLSQSNMGQVKTTCWAFRLRYVP